MEPAFTVKYAIVSGGYIKDDFEVFVASTASGDVDVKGEYPYMTRTLFWLLFVLPISWSHPVQAGTAFEVLLGRCKFSVPGEVLAVNFSDRETVILVDAEDPYSITWSGLNIQQLLDDGAILVSSSKLDAISVYRIRVAMEVPLDGQIVEEFALLEFENRSILISGKVAESYWNVDVLRDYTSASCTD